MKKLAFSLAFVLLFPQAVLADALAADTFAIVGGRVITGNSESIQEDTTIIIKNGRIVALGRNVAIPKDAQQIDAKGKWVTAGLFAANTSLGLAEIQAEDRSNDEAPGRGGLSAAFDVSLALDPTHGYIANSRQEGITRAMVVPQQPSQSIFGGFGALIRLTQRPLMQQKAFQYVELGERGAGISGGSRATALALFQNALTEARQYDANRLRYIQGAHREAFNNKLDTEALIPVIRGQIPIVVHVESAIDIQKVIALKNQFKQLSIIISGASEAWQVADDLVKAKIPVIISPLENTPTSFESIASTMNNAGRLAKKGVLVAFGLSADDGRTRQAYGRVLTQYAGNIVAQAKIPDGDGMTWLRAFQAITLNPARIFGVEKDLGSLEVGKMADVVIWDGDPLELSSLPVEVLIEGRPTDLRSRRDALRDRYQHLEEEKNLPLAYPR